MAMRTHDLFNVCSGAEHGRKAAVAKVLLQIVDVEGIGIDDDQLPFAWEPVEDWLAERADTWPILYEDFAFLPLHPGKHLVNRETRRRNDRTDHLGMFEETLEENTPLTEQARSLLFDAAAFDCAGTRLSVQEKSLWQAQFKGAVWQRRESIASVAGRA